MRRFVGTTMVFVLGSFAAGQSPPPQLLPSSVTGANQPAPAPVSPASGVAVQPTAPIARFQNLHAFPPETHSAVSSARAGADWLWRMNQPNGRFFPGLNPAVRMPVEGDSDFRQALAALALAEAARFTGDERFAARAVQAVLSLLVATRPDPTDAACRVPTAPSDQCNRVGFAAVLALAIYALPNPDASLHGQAGALCAFLRKQCRPNGAIHYSDGPNDESVKVDPTGEATYPGLAIQAMLAGCRSKPDAATMAVVAKAIGFYREAFKARPSSMFAATLLSGFVEFALMTGKDPGATAAAFELADWLCVNQYSRSDARSPMWVGGFKSTGEPGHESAASAGALAAAAKLTRQVPDLTRFRKYRNAAVEGLAFARGIQFTDESADHFEKSFRARFLTGAVHLSPSDGVVRIDATAHVVMAQLTFLQSGAEGRVD